MAKEKFDDEALAAKLEAGFTQGDAGTFKAEGDMFEQSLPEDMPLELVKKVQQHISNFVDGATLGFGRVSIKAFKGDKALESTQTKLQIGADKLKINMRRTAEVPDGKDGKQTKYGQIRPAYLVSGGNTTGSMKRIRETLGNEAATALAD